MTDDNEETTEDEQNDLTELDPADIDPSDLEEQEWTLGEGPTQQVIEFKQMRFLVEDPDDDAVLNMMAEAEIGEGDTSDRMFQLCDSAIQKPELSPERWGEMRVSEAIGLSDMIDFPETGENPQQAG